MFGVWGLGCIRFTGFIGFRVEGVRVPSKQT